MSDDLGRPEWDDYFMALCFIIAQKSIDPNTKHGCIAVNDDRSILSTGYNGPPRGCIDMNVPSTRPEKYTWTIHAESNCVINSSRNGVSLKGSTFYITGLCCPRCLGAMINAGVKKIIYGNVSSKCLSEEDLKTIKEMMIGQSLTMRQHNCENVPMLLGKTKDCAQKYLDAVLKEQK